VALSATYYTRGGAVIARLEAGEDDQPDLLQAALTPAEGVAAAEPATASPVIPAARQRAAPAPAQERLAALMFGAPSARTSPKPEIEAMFGGEAAIHALEAALLLGLAPIARGTLKQRGKSPVPSRSQMALYDMAQDRFEGADEAPEPIDLPLSTHSDQGAVDWIVME
jgi:pyruvate/2-oxoglutarate dehydrogenase complex dihydrolipoamide acyltransferase (E2) component